MVMTYVNTKNEKNIVQSVKEVAYALTNYEKVDA
jgi:hypothetical protein